MEEILQELRALRAEVAELKKLYFKGQADTTWLSEDEAAALLGYNPRTLRQKVKKHVLPIESRSNAGRSWQYTRKSIEKYKQQTMLN